MFHAIRVENFRGFGDLQLAGLGRVNLIVGKNNTGKTSLLEAVTLVANPEMFGSLPGLFRSNTGDAGNRFFRWLFKDAKALPDAKVFAEESAGRDRRVLLHPATRAMLTADPLLSLAIATPHVSLYRSNDAPFRVHAVAVEHRDPDKTIDVFAEAVRAPVDEKQMESLLAAVDPRIKSVRLDSMDSKPFISVDVGLTSRIPLSQAGQGVYRLVAIFSELLGSKPNLCFIDEIENGIHYSALPALWQAWRKLPSDSTSRSSRPRIRGECLVAAHETFETRDRYDLRVVQLYRLGDAVSGRVLDRPHIEAAISGELEVR